MRHIAYSKKEKDTLPIFLEFIASEVARLESKDIKIADVIFSFPDKDTTDPFITATVYFNDKSEGYAVDHEQLLADSAESPSEALQFAYANVNKWAHNHAADEIYDVRANLLLDSKGDDIVKIDIYYGSERLKNRY